MFSDRKHPPPQKRIDCLIGAGTSVRGDIVFTGGLRVDGRVEGNVATVDGQAGTLVISEQARIDGEIRVSHIVVNGTVNGPVTASDYLELQPKARLTGDVSYKTLEMHVGAVIQGRLNHGAAEPESASVVELKRVQG
ncbi:MAG: polymer-forming cytoskeletal protein [Burkholderiales bacterium]|jgi:cytoskeletal protein CcmA (bactofilin family)|nr:polymer-forming cytoskeletal protein [Burkholderiales bacterium]